MRRRWPLGALVVSSLGVLVHILANLPEGSLPTAVLFLTYSVGAWCSMRRSVAGLAVVDAVVVILGLGDSPGLDAVGVLGVMQAGVELSAYRIVQEALTNVMSAQASRTRVDVTVRYSPVTLTVEVVDNGRGIARPSRATATPLSTVRGTA